MSDDTPQQVRIKDNARAVCLAWALLVLALGAVFAASARGQVPGSSHTPNGLRKCQIAVAGLASRAVMSESVAMRYSRELCFDLRDGTSSQRYLFRAIVQK